MNTFHSQDTAYNPALPSRLREKIESEKKQGLKLYLDFVIDGTASRYTIFPAVYFAIMHFIESLARYEIHPMMGITVIRDEAGGEETEQLTFCDGEAFTEDVAEFMRQIRAIRLYGGANDGKESVHHAIGLSLAKFPSPGRNKAVLVFSDAYGSNDYEEYLDYPLGQAVFFITDELSQEDFRFCFVREDGCYDEEASPMFLPVEKLLRPMSTELLDNVVKPLKDLLKGVSIGI